MSEIWLGAFLALGVWSFVQVVLASVLFGREMEIGVGMLLEYIVLTLGFLMLAVLTYTGVVL